MVMKKNIISPLLLMFVFLIILSPNCSAVHSGIYKNIPSYSCSYYDTYLSSTEVETNVYKYFGDKKMDIITYKRVKYPYLDYISKIIHEAYPKGYQPYDPDGIMDLASKHCEKGDLFIREEVYFNLRTREYVVINESLTTDRGQQVLIWLPSDLTFRFDEDFESIDNSPVYGRIANDAIAFLESIKDIYFDDKTRKEYEQRSQHSKNFKYYWQFLRNKWEKGATNFDKSKAFFTKFCDIYVDVRSFLSATNGIKGWIRLDYNIEKYKSTASENGRQIDAIDTLPKTTYYYVELDYDNNQFSIFAGYELLQNGTEKKYVLNKPEIWTYSENPDIVISVLNKVAEVYNNKKRYGRIQ